MRKIKTGLNEFFKIKKVKKERDQFLGKQKQLKELKEVKPIFEKIKELASGILLDDKICYKGNLDACKWSGTKMRLIM